MVTFNGHLEGDPQGGHRDLVKSVRLVIQLTADLLAFGLLWFVLNVVERMEGLWPLHGWAGELLTHIHQFGVVACALWTTVCMVGHTYVILSGRKLGAGS